MTAARPFPSLPLAGFALLLLAIYAAETVVAGSSLLVRSPEIGALAITLDLVVLVPLLFYLLVVRTTGLPAVSVVPVFLLSLLGASLVLPRDHQGFLDLARYLVVPAELVIVGVAGAKIFRGVRRLDPSAPAAERTDPLEQLRAILRSALPVRIAADAAAHEIALLYYALFAWRARPDVGPGEIGFSYHRRNGYGAVLGALGMVATVELVVVHLLLERWSATAAWVLTGISVYGLVWMLGSFQAARLRPILLTPRALHIRVGLLWSVRIPLRQIAAVHAAGYSAPERKAPEYLRAVTLGDAQLTIELTEPVDVQGLYGYTRRGIRRIGVAVDDRAGFEAALAWRLAQPTG